MSVLNTDTSFNYLLLHFTCNSCLPHQLDMFFTFNADFSMSQEN
jgi:hypothetical protein